MPRLTTFWPVTALAKVALGVALESWRGSDFFRARPRGGAWSVNLNLLSYRSPQVYIRPLCFYRDHERIANTH